MGEILSRWARRHWELAGLSGKALLRAKARHWEEDGYQGHEVTLLTAADALDVAGVPLPYAALYRHEAWVRRLRREGLLSRQQVREQGLWMAREWMMLAPLSSYPY